MRCSLCSASSPSLRHCAFHIHRSQHMCVDCVCARECKYVYYLFHSTICECQEHFLVHFHWAEKRWTSKHVRTHIQQKFSNFNVLCRMLSLLFHLSKHSKMMHTLTHNILHHFNFISKSICDFGLGVVNVPAHKLPPATFIWYLSLMSLCECVCVCPCTFVKDILLFWPFPFDVLVCILHVCIFCKWSNRLMSLSTTVENCASQ